jgi:hypothetical protein
MAKDAANALEDSCRTCATRRHCWWAAKAAPAQITHHDPLPANISEPFERLPVNVDRAVREPAKNPLRILQGLRVNLIPPRQTDCLCRARLGTRKCGKQSSQRWPRSPSHPPLRYPRSRRLKRAPRPTPIGRSQECSTTSTRSIRGTHAASGFPPGMIRAQGISSPLGTVSAVNQAPTTIGPAGLGSRCTVPPTETPS